MVAITARVQAAETPASFVFEGLLEFLTSNAQEAKVLRKFYTFILFPCLNPDGVVSGNYRSLVAGVDLNRQWIKPEADFNPEVHAVKSVLRQIYET